MTASSRTFASSVRVGRQALVEPAPYLVCDQLPAHREDAGNKFVAADRPDRRQQARRERVVVRGKGDLRIRRHVVEMARPPDAVADRPSVDEARRLEGAELLEDAGPACAEGGRQLLGRARAVAAKLDEDLAGGGPMRPAGPGRDRPRRCGESGAPGSAAQAWRLG